MPRSLAATRSPVLCSAKLAATNEEQGPQHHANPDQPMTSDVLLDELVCGKQISSEVDREEDHRYSTENCKLSPRQRLG
jgi:hypothetical protein